MPLTLQPEPNKNTIAMNAKKYPVEKAKGKATKYDKL